MRYLMFFAFLLLSFISHAADTRFEKGVDAYQNNSYQQAFALFLPLAQAGNVDAQLSVGTMYDRGQGVEQDSQEALKWYQLAAGQGDNIAKSLVKTMFNSAEGATKYEDNQNPNELDTPPVNINSIDLISPALSREEMLNQILNQSRLSVLISPEKTASSIEKPEKSLFSLATYHKIEHWIKNSFIYIAEFIGVLIFGFALFYVLKHKKTAHKSPIFFSLIEDDVTEEIVENSISDDVPEINVIEEISTVHFEAEPVQKSGIVEQVANEVEEKKTLEKDTLFEYCYNNNAYDEEKPNKKIITKIQRRRYKSSVMEYCYEECYH
jgi:Sel1 repeat